MSQPQGCESVRGSRLTSSGSSQAWIQGLGLAHTIIYLYIDEQLECMKLVLQIQSYRNFMTQGNSIREQFCDKPTFDSVAEDRGLQPDQ